MPWAGALAIHGEKVRGEPHAVHAWGRGATVRGMPLAPVARVTTTPRGFLRRTLTDGSRWVLYVPDAYDDARPAPALLFLHGRGEEGSDGWRQVAVGLGPAIMLQPERWPFVVVFPQKPRTPDGWLEHESRALEALDAACGEVSVDPTRIHLTGVSLGGFGCWTIAPRHRDVFASIAPVCGGGDPGDAARLRDLPIWAFHGQADAIVSPRHSERMVAAVRAAGGTPRLTLYPGVGHDSWSRAYREERLAEWLLERRLGETAPA